MKVSKKPFHLSSLVLMLILCIGWAGCFKKMVNLDRSTDDYRNRMVAIWNEEVPYRIEGEIVHNDYRFVRNLYENELEDQVPYMLSYPVQGDTPSPAMLVLPASSTWAGVVAANFSFGTHLASLPISRGVQQFTL